MNIGQFLFFHPYFLCSRDNLYRSVSFAHFLSPLSLSHFSPIFLFHSPVCSFHCCLSSKLACLFVAQTHAQIFRILYSLFIVHIVAEPHFPNGFDTCLPKNKIIAFPFFSLCPFVMLLLPTKAHYDRYTQQNDP